MVAGRLPRRRRPVRRLRRRAGARRRRAGTPVQRGAHGLLLGDGVAAVVLESPALGRPPRAPPLARLAGWGRAGDAYHVCQPDPAARDWPARSPRRWPAAASTPTPSATSTRTGPAPPPATPPRPPRCARRSDRRAADVPVSSTKSVHGQALEASGLLELIVTVLALRAGSLPVNAGYLGPDPACDLDVVTSPRAAPARVRAEPQQRLRRRQHRPPGRRSMSERSERIISAVGPFRRRAKRGGAMSTETLRHTTRLVAPPGYTASPLSGPRPGRTRPTTAARPSPGSSGRRSARWSPRPPPAASPPPAAPRRARTGHRGRAASARSATSPAPYMSPTPSTRGDRVGPLLFFQSVPNAVAGHVAARWGLTGPVVCLSGRRRPGSGSPRC